MYVPKGQQIPFNCSPPLRANFYDKSIVEKAERALPDHIRSGKWSQEKKDDDTEDVTKTLTNFNV